ncbi:MAG: hypothetical protein RJA81_1854 [Planctomycetota bacterium]
MILINRLHRQLAATGFVVLALILPTIVTLWWVWTVNRPGHVRDVEVQLSRQLGMQIGLDAVRYPRPGEMILVNPVFRHEEPRGRVFRELARAKSIVLKTGQDQLQVEAFAMQIVSDSADSAVSRLSQILSRMNQQGATPVRIAFSADTCEVLVEHGASGRPVRSQWKTIAGMIDSRPDQATIQASVWNVDRQDQTRCELKLVRKRQGEQAATEIQVATMEGSLPAVLLEPLIDTRGWMGEKATVQGQITMRQTEQQPWDASFAGTFQKVDLSKLVTGRFGPYRLSGDGKIHIRKAQWGQRVNQGSGWREVEGDMTAGPGSVSHGLLLSMGQQMKFRIIPDWIRASEPGETVEFGGIGLQFHLTEDGNIQFGGACGPDFGRDVVAISRSSARPKPVVAAPNSIVTVRGLLKTLFPVDLAQAELLVPTTRESQALQRYLPMPVLRQSNSQVLPVSHQ